MIVTYRDNLGVVSVKIDDEYGISFDDCFAYYTDKNGTDHKTNIENLIIIVKEI